MDLSKKNTRNWKKRARDVLEPETGERDVLSRSVDIFLVGLILLNVAAIILESIEGISAGYQVAFAIFEAASVLIFSFEYILRVWSSVEAPDTRPGESSLRARLRFALTPMAIVDLAAILPFFLQIVMPGVDLRFIRVLRMVRVFKLTRYSNAMAILLQVLSQERKSFGAAFFILTIVTFIASCGIYLFEYKAQPVAFASIPAAMWWAVSTLTTVGYGDVTPITAMGKFFGGIISIIGIGMVAMPTGILASGFNDLLRQRERKYETELLKAMENGIVTGRERAALEELKKSLGLTEETARILSLEALANLPPAEVTCPHCGGSVEVPRELDEPS